MITEQDRKAFEQVLALFGYGTHGHLCDACLTYYCAVIAGVTGDELALFQIAACSVPELFGLFIKEVKAMYDESSAGDLPAFCALLANDLGKISRIMINFSLAVALQQRATVEELPPLHPN